MRSLKKTISLNQAAKISGYTQDHLGYLIRKGEIKGEKKAGIWLTSEDDVKRYISRQKNLHKKIVVKNFISRYFVRSVLVLGSILLVGSFLIGFKVYGNYNNNSQSILSILSSSVSNEVSKVYNSLTKGDQAITSSHLTASASTSGIDLFSSVGNKLTSISDGLAYGWSEFTFGLLDNVEEFLFNTKKFSNALKSGSLFSPKKNTVAQISPTPSQKENKQNNSADKKQSQKSIEDNVVAVAPKIITNRIIEKTKTVIVNQTDRSLLSRIEGLEKSLLGLISFNDRQTIATQDSSSKHVASSAKSITEGGTLNDSVLNDATLNGLTTLNGSTNLLNSFSQTGPNTFSTGTGVVSLNGPTNIAAGNSFTSNGQALFTRVPTLAHIFSSTWPAGVSNVDDSSIYVNPLSAVADGNLIGAAVNGNVKFLVDAEGDIYGNNLILQGSTTSASNTIGTLNVTDNTTLGDADTDSLTIRSNIIDLTGSAPVIDSIAGPLYINSKTNNLVNFGSGIVTIPSLSVTTATGI